MARADRVLFVIDGAADPAADAFRELAATLPAQVPVTLVYNKSDATDPQAVAPPASDDSQSTACIVARMQAAGS